MELARNDFGMRFAGSFFGIVWAFIQPIVTVLLRMPSYTHHWHIFLHLVSSAFLQGLPVNNHDHYERRYVDDPYPVEYQ